MGIKIGTRFGSARALQGFLGLGAAKFGSVFIALRAGFGAGLRLFGRA